MNESKSEVCRVLVLGSHRNRHERVFSILDEMRNDFDHQGVEVQFLPAVATFDSYEDESGKKVRYLMKIDYFPITADGTLDRVPHSLLPFFDETRRDDDPEDVFFGIATAVIGSGLDGKEDGEKIKAFLNTASPIRSVHVKSMQPNSEFQSMAEEFAAFKQLDPDARAAATKTRSMGPGKVAKFAIDTAQRLLSERRAAREEAQKEAEVQAESLEGQVAENETPAPHIIDPDKKRYSCRKCRTILFGVDDLEDPPHIQAKHNFGYRKAASGERTCQSIFLHSVPPWVTADTSENEGKISCPKCDTKVGHWNWSGAQCSCGTWVCPAIQVPSSRVDEVLPHAADQLPTGTVISPLLASLMQSQQR